jgi:hypothetical protein
MLKVLASVDLNGRRHTAGDRVLAGLELETELAIGASRHRRGCVACCDDGYDDAAAGCFR